MFIILCKKRYHLILILCEPMKYNKLRSRLKQASVALVCGLGWLGRVLDLLVFLL